MTIISEYRARRIRSAVVAYRSANFKRSSQKDCVQLERLNESWHESRRRSQWARAYQKRFQLPDYFTNWASFVEAVPIMRKEDIRRILKDVTDSGEERVRWVTTGGTTAEPIRIPTFISEATVAELDHWLGRTSLGIDPADRLFLLWGHSHVFNPGLKGFIGRVKRKAADSVLGYSRWSAYDLSEHHMRRGANALIRARPTYVIGYSSAIDRFARVNMDRALEIHDLGLKAVIATAEAFPNADSRETIGACFGSRVVMEYGSVETGPMAFQSEPGSDFNVFTSNYRLDLDNSLGPNNLKEILVTCLYPRAMPLFRYAIGDAISVDQTTLHSGIEKIGGLIGRSNDVSYTGDGKAFHSETFTHILRDIPSITGYQIVRGAHGIVRRIRYEAVGALEVNLETEIRRRLALVDPGLKYVSLEHVKNLSRSIAGKRLMVVDEA